jgi:3'-phosphoadenosine 5'-phosphosulfate sulfotransferase (PAPS reductase)/FAD synthetase
MWSSRIYAELLSGKKVFALFSGGKDSLCSMVYTKEVVEAYGVECELRALHVDTGISLPGVKDYVREVCSEIGIELIVVRPEKTFEEYVERFGIPNWYRRWCCSYLKIEPIKRYLMAVDGDKLLVDGVRRAESSKRSKYAIMYWYIRFPCPTVSPILYWTDEGVRSFIRARRLPVNPVYNVLNKSGECMCGAHSSEKEFLLIKEHYPEFFRRLIEIEGRAKTGYTYIFKDGKRLPLREL